MTANFGQAAIPIDDLKSPEESYERHERPDFIPSKANK